MAVTTNENAIAVARGLQLPQSQIELSSGLGFLSDNDIKTGFPDQ
jgi:hypothetical protein